MSAWAKLEVTESTLSPHLPFIHQAAGQAYQLFLPTTANNLLTHHWHERKTVPTCARTLRGLQTERNQKRTVMTPLRNLRKPLIRACSSQAEKKSG